MEIENNHPNFYEHRFLEYYKASFEVHQNTVIAVKYLATENTTKKRIQVYFLDDIVSTTDPGLIGFFVLNDMKELQEAVKYNG